MANFVGNMSGQFNHAYLWADGIKTTIHQNVSDGIQRTYTKITDTCHSMNQKINQNWQSARQKCQETALKTKIFILTNRKKIFFVGCSLATAYFSPQLFFPLVIATIIVRVEFSHYVKQLAEYYLKPERNPYRLHPQYGPTYISSLDLTMGAIAAINAIALGTFFIASSWAVTLSPALGGIATGSSLAKWGMDTARSWAYRAPPAQRRARVG